jgi:hypothetical protein
MKKKVTNCFWDIETSEQNSSIVANGKNCYQMKQIGTFSSVGWDFNNIWHIDENINEGYPYLHGFTDIVGIEEQINEDTFLIFPNPTESILTVKSQDMVSQEFFICNLNGTILLSGEITVIPFNIDMSVLSKGIYLFKIKNTFSKVIKL